MKFSSTLLRSFVAAIAAIALTIPLAADELPTTKLRDKEYYYYDVAPGETIYSVAKQIGVTRDEILEYNPIVTDGLRAYMRLYFPKDLRVLEYAEPQPEPRHASVSTKPVITAPEVDSAETYPGPAAEPDATNDEPTAQPAAQPQPTAEPQPAAETVAPRDDQADADYTIAVMLPLMVREAETPRTAEHYLDFYRGFLLAASELSRPGKSIRIYGYDTSASLDTVKSIMDRPELDEAAVIIAPENDAQLGYIVENSPAGTTVVNNFVLKDRSYLTTPDVLQGGIPHDEMYSKAIEALIARLYGRTPILLSQKDYTGDKAEFQRLMAEELTRRNIPFVEISYENVLGDEDFEVLDPNGNYILLPASASQNELLRIFPPVKVFNSSYESTGRISLMGYPEWLSFRNEARAAICDAEAVIYSRYAAVSDADLRRIGERFVEAYGRPMLSGIPSQALLGYDTGRFVINTLRSTGPDFSLAAGKFVPGIQSDFNIENIDGGGEVNRALMIITFNHDGSATNEKIRN